MTISYILDPYSYDKVINVLRYSLLQANILRLLKTKQETYSGSVYNLSCGDDCKGDCIDNVSFPVKSYRISIWIVTFETETS